MGLCVGRHTVKLRNPVYIASTASFVGKKEGDGPLKDYFDYVSNDAMFGERSWEKAESKFFKEAFNLAIQKSGLEEEKIGYMFSGDLLNQCGSSAFGLRDLKIPFFGIYGACSTFGEALSLGAMILDGGFAENIICGEGSHFCSAEKQFRFPLDLGTQRPPTSTWTVTGAGAAVLSADNKNSKIPKITYITTGKIIDMGIKDAANMGAAMAGAACDVLSAHFNETGRSPEDYDVIATGDLGEVGKALVKKYMAEENIVFDNNLTDCGLEIYNNETQDTHSGGSGCGCSAVTFCGYYYKLLMEGKIRKMLLVPTGALLNNDILQQGESIPAIAHAVSIEGDD